MTGRGVDLLVVGTSIDPHIDRVLSLISRDVSVSRLNVDEFPKRQTVTIRVAQRDLTIDVDGVGVLTDTACASVAWFRRLGQPGMNPSIDRKYTKFVLAESNHLLEGLLSVVAPDLWINEYWATRRASVKPLQYAVAAGVGFNVPAAILSNDVSTIERWASEEPKLVAKTISAPIVYDTDLERGYAFTHVLTEEDRLSFDDTSLAPTQLQQLIDPDYEVRVMSLHGQHVAVRIDADSFESKGIRDWRSERVHTRYSWMELSDAVSDGLSRLLAQLGLDYAASDFIVDKDGRFHYLESNPHGAWLWLEEALQEPRFTTLFARNVSSRIRGGVV